MNPARTIALRLARLDTPAPTSPDAGKAGRDCPPRPASRSSAGMSPASLASNPAARLASGGGIHPDRIREQWIRDNSPDEPTPFPPAPFAVALLVGLILAALCTYDPMGVYVARTIEHRDP